MYGEGNRGGGFRPRGGGGFGGGFGGGGAAPVSVGEELDVRIEAVGEKGDGIARKRGFILFVPNTREGDEVRIRVTKVLRKVGFAEVIGQAQGTPEGSAPAAPAQEQAPPAPEPEPEEDPVDTEDFGEEEEAPAEPESEEPAEEPAPEAPAEEPAPEPPETPEEEKPQDAEQPEGLPPEEERKEDM